MKPLRFRVYADTSVFGGVFDDEFAEGSRAFFKQVEAGRFFLVTSAIVHEEIEKAPTRVARFFEGMLHRAELLDVSDEALRLREAYLDAGIVPAESRDDALHVALATASGCAVIVSWNFRHIVHFQKIPMYNALNELNGYRPIAIHSPTEVIAYESEGL